MQLILNLIKDRSMVVFNVWIIFYDSSRKKLFIAQFCNMIINFEILFQTLLFIQTDVYNCFLKEDMNKNCGKRLLKLIFIKTPLN